MEGMIHLLIRLKEESYKNVSKIVLLLMTISLPLMVMANDVMKIYLKDNVEDINLTELSKIIYDNNMMNIPRHYNLNDIRKIEFYEDDTKNSEFINLNGKISKPQRNLEIIYPNNSSKIYLKLQKTSNIKVSLLNINGRKIGVLFNGKVNKGILDIKFDKDDIAAGYYCIIVRNHDVVYVKKIIIK